MKFLQALAAASVLLIALAVGTTGNASANSLLSRSIIGQTGGLDGVTEARPGIIKAAHRKRRGPRAKAQRKLRKRNVYKRHHRRFHQRYQPKQRRYRGAHRRFHRHYGKRHSSPGIYFGIYPYYNPSDYNPYYYDPYYDAPSYYIPPRTYRKLSCKRVRNILRRHGYHRVRAYDCKGKTYGFYGRAGGKTYRLRVNAYSGNIKSRRRL